MWQRRASRLWECWAATRMPAPQVVRTTMGSLALPPNMYFIFAIWFMIWSMAMPMKSMNMSSTTGRRPQAAEPTARPMMPASEMGVSTTRRSPYLA